jgi:peptidoglycan/xylan/chitin deacetylase (PgdA/CDA1 family)
MREDLFAFARNAYGAALYYSGAAGLCRRSKQRSGVRVLAYHQIDRQSFEGHLRYLVARYEIMSLQEAYRVLSGMDPNPPNALALTFDDGHLSFYREVFPVLKRYQVPATVFIATDLIGSGELYWFDRVDAVIDGTDRDYLNIGGRIYAIGDSDKGPAKKAIKEHLKTLSEQEMKAALQSLIAQGACRGDPVPEGARVVDWCQAIEMQASGLVEIGSHTCSHPILRRLPGWMIEREVVESKRILEARLGTTVRFLAYPNGSVFDVNPEVVRRVRAAGYLAAFTLIEGACRPGDDLFTLKRISASGAFTYQTLAAKLGGLWPFTPRAYLASSQH